MMTGRDQPMCVVFGGGGHARVVIDCIQASGVATIIGILDSDETLWGTSISGVTVAGADDKLDLLRREGATHYAVGIGGVGSNVVRKQLFELGEAAGLLPLTVRHPSVISSPAARLAAGCQLLPGSVINAGADVGRNAVINTGAIVEHDCVIEDHAHVATGARLAGGVQVGQGAFVGAGATVIQGIRIGEGAVVGAGSVVIRDVPPRATVVGVPARPLETNMPAQDGDA